MEKIREAGGVVTARIVVAAAHGILVSLDRETLVEFGRHVELSLHWAYHFLDRIKFVRRKVTTSKNKHSFDNFLI